jgi:2-methylcitrate dehydratase MmgE/PrpD-like protein
VSGRLGDRARPAWDLARGSAPADATLLVDGTRVHVEQAAFANAVALHARAQDDTHYPSQTHPGAAIMPAALALAEQRGPGGPRVPAGTVVRTSGWGATDKEEQLAQGDHGGVRRGHRCGRRLAGVLRR